MHSSLPASEVDNLPMVEILMNSLPKIVLWIIVNIAAIIIIDINIIITTLVIISYLCLCLAYREKKKREERAESQKANEAVKKCLVESL